MESWSLCILGAITALALPAEGQELQKYLARSRSVGQYDVSAWKGVRPAVQELYPLGFSKTGWFAFVHSSSGDPITDKIGSCKAPPCRDGVQLVNLACTADPWSCPPKPDQPGSRCFCPWGQRVKDLRSFGILPLVRLQHGTFPTEIADQQYRIEIVDCPELIPSEGPAAKDPATGRYKPVLEPGTQVFLISRSQELLIRTLDHGHEGVIAGTVQAAGWVRDPFRERLVVILGYAARWQHGEGPPSVELLPVGADLAPSRPGVDAARKAPKLKRCSLP